MDRVIETKKKVGKVKRRQIERVKEPEDDREREKERKRKDLQENSHVTAVQQSDRSCFTSPGRQEP